jgi:lactoylglutathione lyase
MKRGPCSPQQNQEDHDMSDTPALAFGWTILHVADVGGTVDFYERAFALRRRFVDPKGEYAELETGATALAFAAHSLVDRLGTHAGHAAGAAPHGFEIALVSDADMIEAAYERALAAGAVPVKPLAKMPWGQTVGFVRDPNGILVEICTPTAAG